MTQRVVSVGDDFALPAGTKVLDSHLPARLADAALNATYVTYRDASTGLPLTGKHVTITVNTTTNEITDIVVEAI
jgi:hypothetical protein